MAIRNVVTGGIGLNNDVIGWIITAGFGDLSAGEAPAAPSVLYGSGIFGRFLRLGRRRMHPRGG